MARKRTTIQTTEIEQQIEMQKPEIEITELKGKLNLLSNKIDDLKGSMSDLKASIDKQSMLFDRFVTKEEFNRHVYEDQEMMKQIDPAVKWVNNRIAVEKFLYGLIGFLGLSQLITILLVVAKTLS